MLSRSGFCALSAGGHGWAGFCPRNKIFSHLVTTLDTGLILVFGGVVVPNDAMERS